MRAQVIKARWWYHDTKYVGHQPPPLEQQLQEQLDTALEELQESGCQVVTVLQSLAAAGNGTVTAVVTVLYNSPEE